MQYLSDERLAAVRSAYERGVGMREIGHLYGIHRATVSNYAKRFGWSTPQSRMLQAKLIKLRRQHRSERVTERMVAQQRKRHIADWHLIRGLVISSIDNGNAERAELASQCAQTLVVLHQAERDLSILPRTPRVPRSEQKPSASVQRPKSLRVTRTVTFSDALACWNRGATAARPVTRSQWERIMRDLSLFLGHADASAVTREDVIRWRDHLIAEGFAPATIRSTFIGAPCAVFSAAQDALLLEDNRFRQVQLPPAKRAVARSKGFRDEEARTILLAALKATQTPAEQPCNHMFRKWGPWLCAFTGARIGEIAQLRVGDVQRDGDIWFLNLTPEAGSIKSRQARQVPLHPQLLDLGFLQFVNEQPRTFVFQAPRGGHLGGRSEIIGKWVRSIGIRDKGVSPNHGWRHRFKTLCREHGISNDYHNAVTGHAQRGVGDGVYGEYPVSALHREIC